MAIRPQPGLTPRKESTVMLSRAATTAAAGRASSMRRLRRRAHASGRLYCATNGCASFLVLDEDTRTARCEVCGYIRRLD